MPEPAEPEESGEPPESWSLARMTNPIPEQGIPASISEIRPMDDNEHQRLVAAEDLMNRYGPTWQNTTAVHNAVVFTQALERMEAGRAQAGGQVNEADLNRVSGALRTFAEHVTDWIAGAAAMAGPVGDAAGIVVGTVPLVLCQRIAGGESPVVIADEPHRARACFEGGPQADANTLIAASLNACQLVAEADLIEAEPSLLAAGTVIMGLRAEVVWGEPTLMRTGEFGGTSVSPRPIEWRRVEPILRACAIARSAVARRSNGADPGGPSVDTSPAEAVTSSDAPGEGAAAETPMGTPPPESTVSGSPYAAPVDMAAFVNEATSFAQTTERRWSEALGATIGDDIKDLTARAQTLLATLGRRVIHAGGGGPALPAIPLSPATANWLSLAPEGEQREVQHGIAAVQVISELAQAIQMLSRPTGHRIDLSQGAVTSWWTQHGFNHVQYRAEMAARVIAESGPALSRQLMALLAQAAWTAGLPEACIVYLVRALHPADESNGPLADAYGTLVTAARALIVGEPVSLDGLVPIARFWLDELARRVGGTVPATST